MSKEDNIYFKAFMDALKELKTHTEPSPETIKFIASTSEQLKVINKHFEKDGIIDRIERHVLHTNGRVKKLEIKYYMAVGALIIISSISGYIINDIIKSKDKIHEIDLKIMGMESKVNNIDNRFEK